MRGSSRGLIGLIGRVRGLIGLIGRVRGSSLGLIGHVRGMIGRPLHQTAVYVKLRSYGPDGSRLSCWLAAVCWLFAVYCLFAVFWHMGIKRVDLSLIRTNGLQ